MGATLLGSGQPVERLCSYLISQETHQAVMERVEGAGDNNSCKKGAKASKAETAATSPWTTARLHVVDTLGVMCGVQSEAVYTLVASEAVPLLLKILRCVVRVRVSVLGP